MKRIVFLIWFVAFVWVSQGQNTYPTAKLDSVMQLLEQHNKLWASVSVFHQGKPVYANASGFLDADMKIRSNNSTFYRIGSITKMYTAVLILQLEEENKLKITDRLSKYFPAVKNSEHITLEQMLKHRSGIFSITEDSLYMAFNTQKHPRAAILDKIYAYPSIFEPGSQTTYSNSNYVLLAYIIEDITGKDFNTCLQERIVKPLDLQYTAVGGKVNTARNEAMSVKYDNQRWIAEAETDMSVPGGAGAMVSTPEELNRFIWALFNEKLISPATLERMLSLEENFGYGIFAMPFFENKGFGHTGGIDGYRSALVYYPESEWSVAVCVNAANFNPNELLKVALSLAYDRSFTLPVLTVSQVDASILLSYEGVYSSPEFPLKLTIFVRDGQLFGQATGQPSFLLEAENDQIFRHDAYNIRITFGEQQLELKQGGLKISMTRE